MILSKFLGTMDTPPLFRAFAVIGDEMVGVELDWENVEYIGRYQVDRPSDSRGPPPNTVSRWGAPPPEAAPWLPVRRRRSQVADREISRSHVAGEDTGATRYGDRRSQVADREISGPM